MSETRQIYLERFKSRLEGWNAQIDKLAEKSDKAGNEAKKVLTEKIDFLKAKRTEVEQKFTDVRASTGEAWVDLRTGLEGAAGALSAAVKSAMSRFTAPEVDPAKPVEDNGTPPKVEAGKAAEPAAAIK